MRILVTGANGFVGSELCRALAREGVEVLGCVRTKAAAALLPQGVESVIAGSLDEIPQLGALIGRVDCVVHLAARVHQMRDTSRDPLSEFRRVNTTATELLADWAASRNVKRFVYLSSIKVNGEGQPPTEAAHVYRDGDPSSPKDPYGISKWEAERKLKAIRLKSGLETVILRPTLVHGPNVNANFRKLLWVVNSGLPLPFGRLDNIRSLTYLGNLVDAIRVCTTHPEAAGETFLVSDDDDLSTSELVRELANMLGRSSMLVPVSPSLLDRLGRFAGKQDVTNRLLGSMQVDSSRIQHLLNWNPPFTARDGLRATANWYCQHVRDSRPSRHAP